MRPVSAAFTRTVSGGSVRIVSRATVCSDFQTGTQPTGVRIPIHDGEVTLDGTADQRGALTLTTEGDLWPRLIADPLAPYGNEIYVETGVQYSDELVEYVGLGYFRIQSPEQDEAPAGPITVEARDRMAGIIDARLLAPRQFLAGATLQSVFDTLIHEVYPTATVTFDDSSGSNVLTRSVIVDEKRFEFLDDIVKSLGKIWYWDHAGQLAIKSVPSPTTPVIDIMSGPGGAVKSVSRKLTRDRVYNAVVATGSAADTDTTVRGVAFDDNPNSPTYFYGRFGPVPRFYNSQFLATAAQAEAAATAMLRRSLGLPYNVDFTAVPNPALEPWDPVRLRSRDDQAAELHVLESLSIPLLPTGDWSAQTREQTVVLIGTT